MQQAEVTSCDLTIGEDSVAHYDANVLPAYALFGMSLEEVTLPATITTIGENALAACGNLRSVSIPSAVTAIGDDAFNNSGLTSVTVPATVSTLGNRVFANCRQLTEATYLPADEQAVSEAMFSNCTALETVNLGANVTAIGARAFAGCTSLQNVNRTADNLLETIGESAFEGAGLDVIDFSGCENLTTVGMWAFANTPATRVILPESVTDLGQGAFFYDTELQNISLPATITTFEDFLMAGCNSYADENVVGSEVTTIGDYVFYNWDQMASFVIPKKVSYIGTRAMAGMTNLESVTAHPTTVPDLGDDVWEGVDQPNVPLRVDETLINDYKAAAQWQEFRIVSIPTAVENVTADAASSVKAHFAGTTLIVEAPTDIAQVSLFSVNGVMLNQVAPAATRAQLETVNYQGRVYIVNVVLTDGSKAAFKLLRD